MQKKKNNSKIKNNSKLAKNGFGVKALIGTIGIFVAGVLIFFVADLFVPFGRGPGMMEIMANVILIKILLSFVLLGFSTYLIFDYLKSYLQVRNEMLLGVLLAVISFMMFAISSNPIIPLVFGQRAEGVFSVVPLVFAAAALGTLAWISTK